MKFLSAFGDRSSTSSSMATLRRRGNQTCEDESLHHYTLTVKYSLIHRAFDLGGLQFYFEHRASSDLKVVASYNSWISKSSNLSLTVTLFHDSHGSRTRPGQKPNSKPG